MKKILSILLVTLLACLPMAVAESAGNNAGVIILSDIEVMGNSLGDLSVMLGVEAADVPQSLFSAFAGEEVLVSAVGEIHQDEIRFMFDGEDKAYSAKLSDLASGMPEQVAAAVTQMPELLKQVIPALDQLVLPMVPAITIPKIDLSEMLGGGDTFELTTEQVDSLLAMGGMYVELFSSRIPQGDQIKEFIAQMEGKISVKGTFADDGDAKVTRADILIEGQAAGTLVLTSVENNLRLAVEADGAEQGGLTVTSDPDTATLNVDVDAAGNVMGGFSIYQEDGLQKIVFEINAGEKVAVEFDYGARDGRDIVSLVLDGGSQGGLDFIVDTAMEGSERVGTVSFESTFNHNEASFNAGVVMYQAESLELGEITWPEELLPMSEINASESLQPVIDYIQSVTQDAAA